MPDPRVRATQSGFHPIGSLHEDRAEIRRLRAALEEAQCRLEWVVRDRREPDKVLLNVASVGRVIQRALNEEGR